jgi:hypothetical protein
MLLDLISLITAANICDQIVKYYLRRYNDKKAMQFAAQPHISIF